MTNTNTTKHKHMTLEDRSEIQSCLDHGMTFKAIGKRIGKDRTTISKKVKKHLDIREGGIQLCDINGGTVTVEICPALLEAPFVCNPCKKRHARCKFCKQFYNAKKAQRAYETLRLEVREGLSLTKESFYEIDRIISEGIKRGQHLYHIIQTKNFGFSKSTVYRHLKKGYLSVSPIDLPRAVKFKPRKQRPSEYVPQRGSAGHVTIFSLTPPSTVFFLG